MRTFILDFLDAATLAERGDLLTAGLRVAASIGLAIDAPGLGFSPTGSLQ